MERSSPPWARRSIEGRVVSVVLADGSRFEKARVVLLGRGGLSTLWLEVGGVDRFVESDQVSEMCEVSEGRAA
jgi:hypothetical protein